MQYSFFRNTPFSETVIVMICVKKIDLRKVIFYFYYLLVLPSFNAGQGYCPQ